MPQYAKKEKTILPVAFSFFVFTPGFPARRSHVRGVEHCPDTGTCLLREGFRFPCGEEFLRGNERAAFHVEVPRFVPAVTGKAVNEFGL